ncbi:hypothetical protein PENTCL1PPCAC_16663 [Pristionchus entomophagus]|uniref:G protein-coupled receptor n=1 Tax=Pristionchus entomophagus TaxID=358040 RepID=A0AAV5TJM7_9BILA|nr:hypothetical protein PENTCL1PPCAC_16663 [Pristionchus entomophagus]
MERRHWNASTIEVVLVPSSQLACLATRHRRWSHIGGAMNGRNPVHLSPLHSTTIVLPHIPSPIPSLSVSLLLPPPPIFVFPIISSLISSLAIPLHNSILNSLVSLFMTSVSSSISRSFSIPATRASLSASPIIALA